jgi:Xaa-Pro aminopeptidase
MKRNAIRSASWVVVWFCAVAPALAGPAIPGPKVFAGRRKALARELEGAPVLVFGAGPNLEYTPFRQNNRFYYLTGVNESGAVLLLVPSERKEILFLDPGDPKLERWDGPRLKPGPEAEKRTGFRVVRHRDELPDFLDRLLAGKPAPQIHFTLSPEEIGRRILDSTSGPLIARRQDPLDGGTWRENRIRLRLEERYKGLTVYDASPVVRRMREIKGPEEIAALREAGRISALGMIEAIKAARPGMYEYQIEAVMAKLCRDDGAQEWAYAPIVGSGRNSLILHYDKSERKMEAGDLVLMDAAYFWNFYASDITRTFPVGERFTDDQRKAYTDLLEVQEKAIRRVRPGTTLLALHAWVNRKLRAKGYARNLAHFLGHFVGLAVHDPGNVVEPLRPGHVITIEPGIYFDDKGFGMRIEDVVLVTPSGCEVLTAGIPKSVEAIEALAKD